MIDQLVLSPMTKLNRISRLLEMKYNTVLNFNDFDLDSWNHLYEESLKDQQVIRESVTFNTYYQNPKYMRACLLQEAVKIFLTELHPRRSRMNKNEKGDSI